MRRDDGSIDLRAPFPWFGGKSRASALIWDALGDVDNYVEPFAGSLAVLLGRPVWHRGTCETANDLDAFVANFWRALAADPAAVAREADWPVNETDLAARHLWLVNTGRERLAAMEADPDYYDARTAGWWVWGQCAWIGSGWCSGTGPWHLAGEGRGVNRKRPHLADEGRGVNRQLPHLGDYLAGLAGRLRRVRVCNSDWSRVVTRGAMSHGATVGILLDPPYSGEIRDRDIYATDDCDIAKSVHEWAIAHGDDRRLRIVLCGYQGEHPMPAGWRTASWTAGRAYGSSSGNGRNGSNRHMERLWLSPGCQHPAADRLFAVDIT